ncbi:hypothetical protein [Micromonospora sp. CA-246542]|uniref:hypothetical protein n=1 Tax=Micromonospora sp. CA-246542 TaxID=3239959 RepID=UPI003D94BF2C
MLAARCALQPHLSHLAFLLANQQGSSRLLASLICGTRPDLTDGTLSEPPPDSAICDLYAGCAAADWVVDYRAQVDVPADPIEDWETLKRVAPNPLVPTYGEATAAALTDDERERLDTYMTALAAAGTPHDGHRVPSRTASAQQQRRLAERCSLQVC